MIYLVIWSCGMVVLLMLCPYVSPQEATPASIISTSVNQSLSFGAVSKESHTTILTKLTSSMSVSIGDGHLGSSSVNMSQMVQQDLSVENTITHATSIQNTRGLGPSVPITNTLNPELDQFIHSASTDKMSTMATEPFTRTSKSVETLAINMDGLQTLYQFSTQTFVTGSNGYNDILPSKLSGSIRMSAIPSDTGNMWSTQLPDFFTSAAPSYSSSPSTVNKTDQISLMPSSVWKGSSVFDASAYAETSNHLLTSHSFLSSSLESIYTESLLNWVTISSMYSSEDILYASSSSNWTSYGQLNSTQSGIETFVTSATLVYDLLPSLSPSFLKTSMAESGINAITSSVIGVVSYSALSEADFSDILHSLPLSASFTPSLETSTINVTLAPADIQSVIEWNSTGHDTAFWQINTTVMAHTSSILDHKYDTAGSVNRSTVGVTTIEFSPAEGATMAEFSTVYGTVPILLESSSVVPLSSASANTVGYSSSSLLPSSSRDAYTVSSTESLQPSQTGYTAEPVLTWSLPATPSITPSLLSVSIVASDWLGNSTTDSSTNLLNYTDIQATTLKPTSEWVLNTSDAFAPYWVKTVIKVPPSEDEQSVSFRRQMETKLAGILSEALQRLSSILSGTYKPLRRRRAVTVSNATVQITNISRDNPVETSHTALVYYMIEGDPAGSITSADRTAGLMQLFSEQELAIKFGYEVVVKAEVYIQPPPAKDKKLWIIGAVIGGLAGFVILVWCFLFVYFKCTRPPTKLPSQRPPHVAKVADIDQIDYKGRDVKGFDYARTEVGLESELDRQNVPDYYRRYPMGSTDLEGMYSPGETPPPPFRGHHPSSGSSKRGAKGEPSYPPPAPPSNGFIHPISNKENQAKPDKKLSDEACSTDQDTEDTQGSRRSEDRKPLSSKKGRVSQKQKHKRAGHQPDQFEHVSKMGRVEDPEMLMPPTRTTIHAIKSPVLESRFHDDTHPEIPPDKDINETLQQKAEIERWRNKQRQREKSEQQRAQKHGQTKKSSSRHHPKEDENNEKTKQNGEQPNKPRRKKKKLSRMPVSEQVPVQDNIEMKPVYDHQVIQPVLAGMQQAPLPRLESDSSDDGLEPATGTRDRELVNALLDEAFAMVTPTPTINPPEEPKHPAPQLTKVVPVHQPPAYVSPASIQTTKPTTTWNPYEAGDQVAYLVPPGQIVTSGSRSPSLRDTDTRGSHLSPHSTHQYTNPAYMADLPANIGSQPIRSTDINDSSTPRYGSNAVNGFVPNSPRAFSPYKKPAWTDLLPTAWDDPDKTLPVANRFGERSDRVDMDQPRTQSDSNNFSRFHVPKPTRREDTDDEIDIVSDVMKSGSSAQPLIASIREEIERLAKRSQDNHSQHVPVT